MRSLNLFSESSIGHYLGISLRNKLAAMLEPADAVSKPAVKSGRRKRPAEQPAQRIHSGVLRGSNKFQVPLCGTSISDRGGWALALLSQNRGWA